MLTIHSKQQTVKVRFYRGLAVSYSLYRHRRSSQTP